METFVKLALPKFLLLPRKSELLKIWGGCSPLPPTPSQFQSAKEFANVVLQTNKKRVFHESRSLFGLSVLLSILLLLLLLLFLLLYKSHDNVRDHLGIIPGPRLTPDSQQQNMFS